MPLVMGGVETERPCLIVFDPDDNDQREEAKAREESLRDSGFVLDNAHNVLGEIRMLPPAKKASVGVMRVLTENGDDRIVWDRDFPDQIKDAYKRFKELVGNGYTACVAMSNGKKGHTIDEFDPLAEEIIMVPGTMPG